VLDPGDFQASVRLGVAAAALGRTDDAIAAFDHALAINPACGDCRHRKGAIYLTEWWRGDAVAELAAAAALSPGDASIWSDLGVARAQGGDREGARDAFLRALAIAPNLASAQENLARLERGP
jgi:Flp pilus assembly protein TadD